MTLSTSERLLLLAGVASLPLLVFPVLKHIRNRAFVGRIKVLEELLGSRLHCSFNLIDQPTVEICGKYKDRPVKFISYICGRPGFTRIAEFMLTSSKLPRKKKLLLQRLMVSEDIHQVEDTLVYSNCDDFVSHRNVLEKARAIQILDELVNTAEKCENAKNQEQY